MRTGRREKNLWGKKFFFFFDLKIDLNIQLHLGKKFFFLDFFPVRY